MLNGMMKAVIPRSHKNIIIIRGGEHAQVWTNHAARAEAAIFRF
jgi:hypothetical protein